MAAAVLLPTGFVGFQAERLFFAVADRLDACRAYPGGGQGAFHGRGALVAQRQVVFRGAALVAVALNREVDIGMLIEESRVGLHRSLLIAANVGLVVVKIDVLDRLSEQILVGRRRSGG